MNPENAATRKPDADQADRPAVVLPTLYSKERDGMDAEDPTLQETLAALFEAAPTLLGTPYPDRRKVAEALAGVAMRGLRFYEEHVGSVSDAVAVSLEGS